MRRPHTAWPSLALVVVILGASGVHGESSSVTFVLEPVSPTSGGATATSLSFALTGSIAQPAPTISSAAPAFVLQSGFWSYLGSLPVPIVLAVDRNPLNAEHCDLVWSGNAPPYQIYAAADCSDVLDHPVATASGNALLDVHPPPLASLVCFSVLPIEAPRPAVRRQEYAP